MLMAAGGDEDDAYSGCIGGRAADAALHGQRWHMPPTGVMPPNMRQGATCLIPAHI